MKYIIDFKKTASDDEITLYLNQNNCNVIKIYNNLLNVYLVDTETAPPITDIVEYIVNDDEMVISPLGEIVPVNQYYHLPNPDYPSITISTTDEKDWWKNYVLVNPDLESPSITISRKGTGVSVYIMDSGIEKNHPEFSDSSIVELFSLTDNFTDTTGHGTAIASVISGKTCGLTSATLKIVKIFEENYSTRQSDILNALDSVLGDFLLNSETASILNCSWGVSKNEYIENKFRQLISKGIIVVASAGNSGLPIESITPAAMPEALTIGSYGPNFEPSDFSNYTNPTIISNTSNFVNSGHLDGWTPGEEIWAAGLNEQYGYCSGTSISAGIHSGVLAYNLADALLDNLNLHGVFQNMPISILSGVSLRRNGLMDLSDPKYINSVNRVSTLINKFEYEDEILDYFELRTTVGVEKILGQIYNPQTTKTVEIINTLPEGLTFISSGQIAGKVSSINGTYQLSNSLIRITDINDVSRDVTVVIAIISPDFDATQVPVDDPILEINFSNNYTCDQVSDFFGGAYCPDGVTYFCFNDCIMVGCGRETCAKAGRRACYCYY